MTKSPKEVDAYIGSRVRMRRKFLGMSRNEFCDRLGVTLTQIRKYERGTNRISASRLQKIADVLNVPVPSLFPPYGGSTDQADDEQTEQMTLMQILASSEGVELNKAFSQIKDDKVRRRIIALVHSVAENKAS